MTANRYTAGKEPLIVDGYDTNENMSMFPSNKKEGGGTDFPDNDVKSTENSKCEANKYLANWHKISTNGVQELCEIFNWWTFMVEEL
eukprot:13895193-Ditylum_brightwellii.AAC.2